MAATDSDAPGACDTIDDPAALLAQAWALEVPLQLDARDRVLEQLATVLATGTAPPPPPGRDWGLELMAERALNHAHRNELDPGQELADAVLAAAPPDQEIAICRGLMARARVLSWRGTERATGQADRLLAEVAQRARTLGRPDWEGHAVFWQGHAVAYQTGDLARARDLMEQSLAILGEASPLRPSVLTFYADVLGELGESEAADAAVAEAIARADRDDDRLAHAYAAWTQARIASHQGDAATTERLLREVEREAYDIFPIHTRTSLLGDAAEMLDRLGLGDEAAAYLKRAEAVDSGDEFVHQARATLLARSGDPVEGIEALRVLVHGNWLEKRLRWRHTALTAWATFRAGGDDAGVLASRALEQVVTAGGGMVVARTTESELVSALAPLAEQTGSPLARELLLDGRSLIVRLFGAVRVAGADGRDLELPAGKPGELVRMLALHERGLPVEVVLERFFPDAPPSAGRQRLRQVLTRLRAAAGDIVVRSEETLALRPAWVDARAFLTAADRVRATRGQRAVQLAYAALALRSGPLLPADRYAEWAQEARDVTEYRYLALLDLIAADAATRGAHREALAALDAAIAEEPEEVRRYEAIAEALLALGRGATARYLAGRAGIELEPESGPEPWSRSPSGSGDEPRAAPG